MSKKDNKNTNLEVLRDISADVRESDFVPFAVHYDPHTILTKNGELLQTIKITGFSHEDITSGGTDLRATIRLAITESIKTTDYALWFHTIRRKKNISPRGVYHKDFSGYLNKSWRDKNQFDDGYTNEVYITIVKEGQDASLLNPMQFFQNLIPGLQNRSRFDYLEKAHGELDAVAENMLEILEHYGARRLGIVEHNGVYYSQPCSFFGKLTTLRDQPWPLAEADISKYLTEYDVSFGFNAIEVRHKDGERRFGAMLSLKEYKELNLWTLDRFLQLPTEFIITQCIDFINHTKALKEYEYQHRLFEISGNAELEKKIGLKSILDSDRGSPVDYGEQQLNVFILSDTLKGLDKSVKISTEKLMEIGVIPMREDIKMEECYWAMLPANFEFLKRLRPISTSRIAGFANLSNFPAGLADNNYWLAATLFYTAARTPYYFNFHIGENGHTSIIGPFGTGKTVLTNFLVSEARKYGNRLFYFDHDRASKIFIRSIGGSYFRLAADSPSPLRLNPLLLEDNEHNRSFLIVWLESLISDTDQSSTHLASLESVIDALFRLPFAQRSLQALADAIATAHPDISAGLKPWCPDGAYGYVFNHALESVDFAALINGFDIAAFSADPKLQIPVLSYLLHRITMVLDGNPTIIVLDEAWKLLDNSWFGPRLGEWLESMREHNTVVIFATENVGEAMHSAISPTLMEQVATQIYMPDHEPKDEYATVFNLNEQEVSYIHDMQVKERHFLLKRGKETIVASLNLSGMEDVLAVLSATPEHIALMETCIAEHGETPQKWLPEFFKSL